MISAPIPANEAERQAALLRYDILDTDFEAAYDDLVELAAHLCGTPIALVTLLDRDRQWFKASLGLTGTRETARDMSFCGHAIHSSELMIVPDARIDQRFHDNPLVAGEPHIRFYAGAPLVTPDGHALGTLCVIDSEPHDLSREQRYFLNILARQVMANMQLRLNFKQLQTYAQELHYANASKDKLFSIISHDLKSPFNGIIGLSDILATEAESLDRETIQDFAQDINRSAETAFALLDNLLQWSRLEQGHLSVQPRLLSLTSVVAACHNLLASVAREKDIQLHIAVTPSLVVWADPTMTQSIVHNLLSNAIKFTPRGGQVSLKAYPSDPSHADSDCPMIITVSDTGVGMSAEQLSCLFKIDRCHSTQGTAGEAGTGLGLVLCDQFAQRNQGHLSVVSTPGQGTTFTLTLPASPPATPVGVPAEWAS